MKVKNRKGGPRRQHGKRVRCSCGCPGGDLKYFAKGWAEILGGQPAPPKGSSELDSLNEERGEELTRPTCRYVTNATSIRWPPQRGEWEQNQIY